VTLTKVRSGQRLSISAEAFNAFIDAAEARRSTSIGQAVDDSTTSRAAGIVTVRNDSGSDQERFAVLGIAAPLILPAENPAAFQERVALSLVLPDAEQHADRLCILQEPIAAGALGRGLILGVTPVRLEVASDEDRAAAVTTDDPSVLTTGPEGSVRILWKEPGTGQKWGLVQIPAGGSAGGSPNLVLEVTSASHPWFVGDVLRWNGSEWVFADAAVVGATDTLAVVGRIPDEDTALLVLWGICCLENLAPHTDYWLDPTTPGALTPIKPSEHPRLVLHHAENGLCILRAGDAGSGGAAARFADLSDVDVVTVPPTDQQAALWDAAAERWKPHSVVVADPVPAHHVLAGPESGADAPPAFRDLAVEDLAEIPATSVVANATGAAARPAVLTASENDRALLRVGGTLQWLQIPEAVLGDGVVTTRVLGPGSVTDDKVVSLGWAKLTGVPPEFPPLPHDHPLGGVLTGTTSAAGIAPGAISTEALGEGVVTGFNLAFLAGPSVLGQPAAGLDHPAGIVAASDGTILRRQGGALGFGPLMNADVADDAAIAWSKIDWSAAAPEDVGAAAEDHTHRLEDLDNVSITAPTVGQVLAYDALNDRWVNDDPAGGGPGTMQPLSVWVNATTENADGTDLAAAADNRVLARIGGTIAWTQVNRPALADGAANSVMGRSGGVPGPVTDLVAGANTVLRRTGFGDLGFGKITLAHLESGVSDDGWAMIATTGGFPQWSRSVTLGKNAGVSGATAGSLIVVMAGTGDYVHIGANGIQMYRPSVSAGQALVRIDLNSYPSWTPAKALAIREIDVCENGVARKMLVLASGAY
jgi:hypothetical protein